MNKKKNIYLESKPVKISNDIFRLYQLCSLGQSSERHNTGIMIEDGCFEFMFVKEDNVKLQIRNEKPIELPNVFSLGKLQLPYKFIYSDGLTLFNIKVQPWVSSFFFSNEGYDVLDLKTIYGNEVNDLCNDIFSQPSFKEMIEQVELFFKSKNIPRIEHYTISKKICDHIYTKKGDVKIKSLLDEFSYSRQKLNAIFLSQTKNSMKEFAVLVRIREIMKHKIQHQDKSLTTIALEFGYFDQSHFIKDIKKVTGLSPSKFLSKYNLHSEQLKLPT